MCSIALAYQKDTTQQLLLTINPHYCKTRTHKETCPLPIPSEWASFYPLFSHRFKLNFYNMRNPSSLLLFLFFFTKAYWHKTSVHSIDTKFRSANVLLMYFETYILCLHFYFTQIFRISNSFSLFSESKMQEIWLFFLLDILQLVHFSTGSARPWTEYATRSLTSGKGTERIIWYSLQ